MVHTHYLRLSTASLGCMIKPIRLECGLVPNVMAALPNIGGALHSTLQILADAH